MKKNLVLIFSLLAFSIASKGQTVNSWDGWQINPNSQLRALNIFINIIYDVRPDNNSVDNRYFIHKGYIDWARAYNEGINNEAIPTNLLYFMDVAYNPNNFNGMITRFFGESSFNSLQITGDFVVVNIKESTVLSKYGGPYYDRRDTIYFAFSNIINVAIELINANGGLTTLYGHNSITDYDYENKGQIYFAQAIFRHIGDKYGGFSGSGRGGFYGYTPIKIGNQMHLFSGKGTTNNSLETALISHEIGHSLLGSNDMHTMGGNDYGGGGYMPFLTNQQGYGLFGSVGGKTLESCTGYDRWRLHWKHANAPYYISARNLANTAYLNSDISKANGNISFTLRDFVTNGDVIRIKLPYKDSEAASNQYIWLENHKIGPNNKLDYLRYFEDNDCRPKGAAGIYAYYQIGRDILSGADSEVRYRDERSNLRMIPAEGYWDFTIHKVSTYQLQCVSWTDYTHYFSRETANSFCGYHDMEYQIHPENTDNLLMMKHHYPMIRKRIGSQYIDSLVNRGDNRDAFSTYSKINMGTNPSTCNVKTYYNNTSDLINFNFTAHAHRNNQTTYLTGLSIEMIPQPNMDFLVHIRWDDYDIRNDARWTGTISNKEKVNLLSGNTIRLVQNKTVSQPYRDPTSNLFSQTTVLTCEENSLFTQQPSSTVIVSEKSELVLKSGSQYIVSEGALLRINAGSTLTVEECAILKIDGYLRLDQGAILNIHPKAIIIFEDVINHLHLSGTSHQNTFNSYTILNNTITSNTTITQDKIITRNIYVKSGAVLTIQNTTLYMIPSAKIIVEPGGKLIVDNSTLTNHSCDRNLWQGIEVWGQPAQYVQASSVQGQVELKNGAVIENAQCGLYVGCSDPAYQALGYGGGGIVNAKNTTFRNNKRMVEYTEYTRIYYATLAEQPNLGTFTDCNFILNENVFFRMELFSITMVHLKGVRDIKFNGCIFSNINYKKDCYGGIYIDNASISMTGSGANEWIYPSIPTKLSSFYGIYKCISINNTKTKANVIDYVDFKHIWNAVDIQYSDNVTIRSCNIDVTSYTDATYYTHSYGILLNASSKYCIENNKFKGGYNRYGLSVSSSGEENNVVRYNDFSGLCFSFSIGGVNGNISNSVTCTGLQILCNHFEDVGSVVYLNSGSSTRIRHLQGSTTAGAGNRFINPAITFDNRGQYSINYYWNRNEANHKPMPHNSNSFAVIESGLQSCPKGIGYRGSSYYTIYVGPTIPGGGTITLSSLSGDYAKQQELLTAKLTTYKQRYGNTIDTNILKSSNLSQNAQLQVSSYLEIADISQNVSSICREAFRIIFEDTVFDRNEFHTWLQRENTLKSYYTLAESYVEISDWANAKKTLDKISVLFPDCDKTQHQYYETCLALQYQWKGKNRSEISQGDIQTLEMMFGNEEGIASVKAQGLWDWVHDTNSCPLPDGICGQGTEILTSEKIQKSTESNSIIQNEITNELISVTIHPNPTNNTMFISLDKMPETSVYYQLYDIQGKELQSGNFSSQKQELDIASLSKGIYFISVSVENQSRITKKVVKE